ncbi:ABC transporter permease subunit [Blastopirellula sp. JC732]|uniref:ABC transporter permease subunit n=1 Tax=Blastopirellula sediminis TaxID=2894196 RepID=A0A9X1SHY8_9BACT|nr:ABC transporter permease subunit [Blastopirellula sediminis]MCC9606059.1 ABC transporter permease subunit [Blastopirellula sediminis]MCC9630642.1 ABC transporter permease subunit [Blastopirellula sediminis]
MTSPAQNDAAAAPREKRGHVSKPGLSLLAQGEPMVWLTGGSLALCLLMIFGLLSLVIYNGMRTFWPGRLYQVETVDGAIYLGEAAGVERFELTEQLINSFPSELKKAREKALEKFEAAGSVPVEVERRQYRTGNFDIISNFDREGTHYHTVNEFELVQPEAELPEWAMVIERLSWGRFYGMPVEFKLDHLRPISADEEQLNDIVLLIQSNMYRISDADQSAQLKEALAPVEAELAKTRAANIDAFIAENKSLEGELRAKLKSGEEKPLADVKSAEENVVSVVQASVGPEQAWDKYNEFHDEVISRSHRRKEIEEFEVGEVNSEEENARLSLRDEEINHPGVFVVELANELARLQGQVATLDEIGEKNQATLKQIEKRSGADSPLAKFSQEIVKGLATDLADQQSQPKKRIAEIKELIAGMPPSTQGAVDNFLKIREESTQRTVALQQKINQLNEENARYVLHMQTAQKIDKDIPLSEIVLAFPANRLSLAGQLGVYMSRWGEFLMDDPREANSEGGVFPAIWGTVAMTMIMSVIVVPFGVLAALYLREFAKPGPIVSAIRISINNLAGVPSIVFGVFGFAFLIGNVGRFIDGGPRNADLPVMSSNRWYLLLMVLAATACGAFMMSMYAVSNRRQLTGGRNLWLGKFALLLWIVATGAFVTALATTPEFNGFFTSHLPNPVFGKGCLAWASITLALLTLPVVIVATEEALAAVPNSLREGSYGCGASKWQTIWRIVLPHALPGIMTGMILAMARGAGEVAPLMLVGVLKLAPELPIDFSPPFLHFDRSFMHLGFHIYDLGFQSQNSEAAKPMVYTTTLLLIAVIAMLNLSAIWLRARLRRRFQPGQF